MRPVLLTGFVKYNKALSVVVMQRITRLPGATMGYIECTQDCRTNSQIFHRVNLPWQINRSCYCFYFSASTFRLNFFSTRILSIERRERDIYTLLSLRAGTIRSYPRSSRKREGKMRKHDCYRDEIICEFPRCTDSRVLSPFEEPSPFVGVHLDGRKWTGTKGEAV